MHYRFYGLSQNNRIVSADDVEAAHDADAVAKAMRTDKNAWELWCGTRKVARALAAAGSTQPDVRVFG